MTHIHARARVTFSNKSPLRTRAAYSSTTVQFPFPWKTVTRCPRLTKIFPTTRENSFIRTAANSLPLSLRLSNNFLAIPFAAIINTPETRVMINVAAFLHNTIAINCHRRFVRVKYYLYLKSSIVRKTQNLKDIVSDSK